MQNLSDLSFFFTRMTLDVHSLTAVLIMSCLSISIVCSLMPVDAGGVPSKRLSDRRVISHVDRMRHDIRGA